MPKLYLMRHGHADGTTPDIERQLTRQGRESIKSIARLFVDNNTMISRVIYSYAARAKETALLMCDGLSIAPENQKEDSRIYNASVVQLQVVISEIDKQSDSVLLVGHNPGLADLVLSLTEQAVRLSPGSVAIVQADSWQDVFDCKCRVVGKH